MTGADYTRVPASLPMLRWSRLGGPLARAMTLHIWTKPSRRLQNRAGLARDLDLLVDVHAHEQAEAKHHGQHRGAAIGDERHGNADDRNEAHHHRGVDHD